MAKRKQLRPHPEGPPYFRQWRIAADLSQERLAKLMGISGAQISKREAGQLKGVKLDFLVAFAEAVGCNPWDPIAWPPGTLAQINDLLTQLKPDDLELILGITQLLVDRTG
jgi:transcriptional regulator with XRE-family HTH domain